MPQRRRFAKGSQDVRRFRLVSRSQNDALIDDPDAPPLVLEPWCRPNDARRSGVPHEELLQAPESLLAKHPEAFADPNAVHMPRTQAAGCHGESDDDEDDDEEDDLEGDCYFPHDGYNYEQHLKRVSGAAKGSGSSGGGGVVGVLLEAPRKVPEAELKIQKATTTEEAEVLRALEFADEYDELGDGALDELIPGGAIDADLQIWGPNAAKESHLPDLDAFKAMHAARIAGMESFLGGDDDEVDADGDEEEDDEAGGVRRQPATSSTSRGKGKGQSSSAVARQQAASAAEFEEFFAAEYGEEADVGALDDEEVEGPVSLDNVEGILDEYLEGQRKEKEELTSLYEPQRNGRLDDVPRVIEETKAIIAKHYDCDDEGNETSSGEEDTDESRTWDCESVLSTLSNLSNRPGRIGKIKLIKKPAPTMNPVKEQDDESSDDSSASEVVELPDVITERKKDETAEEKRARKASVREMRKICRKMKKESKETYKAEAAKLPGNKPGNGDIRPTLRQIVDVAQGVPILRTRLAPATLAEADCDDDDDAAGPEDDEFDSDAVAPEDDSDEEPPKQPAPWQLVVNLLPNTVQAVGKTWPSRGSVVVK